MATRTRMLGVVGLAALAVGWMTAGVAMAQDGAGDMSFFVTSVGPGNGGDLGGVEGADAHCLSLAEAAGAGDREWRAYLSTTGDGAVDARDRIGDGPWYNAKGVLIAETVEQLHSEANAINKETALSESGGTILGRGDTPNQHDILTGSQQDGTAAEMTCADWTSSGDDDTAIVGHHDLIGNPAGINFWNHSHPTRGCSQEALAGTGGAGLFYCFAAD